MMVVRREDSPETKLEMPNSCLERLTGQSTARALNSYSASESLELTEVLEKSLKFLTFRMRKPRVKKVKGLA